MRTAVFLALGLGTLFACGEEPVVDDPCAAAPKPDCAPQYDPTFANMHERTLVRSCAVGGGACHATDTASGGFSLAEIDLAHTNLSARSSGECSTLERRMYSDNPAFQMPPGAGLDESELCVMSLWLASGAPR